MADFDIIPMIEIHCEAANSALYDELADQEQRITADAQGSGINTDIPKVELSSTDAKKIGRVIAYYFGFAPNGILATVVGLHDDPAAITRAGKTFCTMASDIQTEKFGKGSFIYKFARGQVGTSNFTTHRHNLAIDAGILIEDEEVERREEEHLHLQEPPGEAD
ncbi:hypothetical protein J4E91_005958 [Alternaria rosae]|nr:hypothetical protein J4E91_005958 [Alternaria rosae]